MPTVSVSDAEAYEDGTLMIFVVSLSQPSHEEVTVEIGTSSGTATMGTDFGGGSHTMTFPPNRKDPQRVSVWVYDDQLPEPDETFTVTLTNPTGATLGNATATGTIRNDDTGAWLTASDIEDTTATLTIGGHTDGWWYKGSAHQCTAVLAGTAAVSISGLKSAWGYEYRAYSDSACNTRLAKVRFKTLAPEGTPTVSVSDAQVSEDDSWMRFTVSLSQPSREQVTVDVYTSDGTATSEDGFQGCAGAGVPGVLTFPANSREPQRVSVLVYDDSYVEPDETFTLTLTNPTGATLGDATATGTIRNDDTGVTLTASDIEDTTATLTIGSHTDGWWYKGNEHPCTAVTAGTTAVSIGGLAAVRDYKYTAYSDSTCNTRLAKVRFGTLAPVGTPTVSVSDAEVSEDRKYMTFEVSLSQPSRERVTVHFDTRDGTAKGGSDFSDRSHFFLEDWYVVFPANTAEITESVDVRVYDDQEPEPDETFTVILTKPKGATLGNATATGTIKDDGDTAATLTPSDIEDTTATLTISGHTDGWWYRGYRGRSSGTLSPLGACTAVTAGTTAVSIGGLTAVTTYEYWAFSDSACSTKLANVEFRTIAPVGTPTVSVSDAQVSEDQTWMTFEVSLSQPSRDEVTVRFVTRDGTATSGTDFRVVSGVLTFDPNETLKRASVLVYNDQVPETDETFTLTLTNPTGATLGDAVATGTIRDDEESLKPLTAEFRDVPAEHEGKGSEFSFELRFSENFPGSLSYKKLRDEALRTTNGRVTGVRRAVHGQNQRWIITVRPRSSADVTVTLSAAEDCTATGAMCTEAGRKLSNTTSATIATESGAPVPARFVSAATEPQGRGLWLTFTKDIWVAGNHADYTVLVGGERRATRAASWEGNRVALVLTESVRAGETVTVAYAKPSDGVKLHDTDELAVESFGPEAVENTLVQAANAPATGVPTISGTAQAGETLTASTAEIADADGLTGAAFAYQWVSNDGSADADIAGATRQSYTLADADTGRRIKVRVTFTDDAGNAESLVSAATAAVARRPNRPATGAPAITGTAQAGETLTASTSGIADADGLTEATFTYQWVSHDGSADTDISGATGSSYLPVDADVGNRIKVRVTFTDDAGNAESLTSALTAAVLPRPLTATFEGMPAEHDGRTAFEFALVFSENFPGRLPFKSLRDEWLQATNARVTGVRRASPGQNQRWVVTVQPDSYLDVTVTLPEGSVTTESGRTLSNTVTATVIGPPLLSVADAQAQEGTDTALAFAVTLSRSASGAVTVDYATADGTATAGEDYTATSGTLTFAAGETSKTVEVPIHDDAHDEGQETFTLTLSNASGAAILDGEATGTIDNDDPMPKAWTARFGRTVAVHVVDAVEARLEGESGSWAQLGGHRLGGVADDPETAQGLSLDRDLWAEAEAASPNGDNVTFRNLLLGSAFHLVSNGEDTATGPRLSAWGRVASSGFDAQEDKVSLDGTVTTATLGVDGVWKRWLTGLLLAYSEGDGSFTHADLPGGDLTSSLTSVHPYVAYTLNDRVRLWGLVGYGSGALRLDLEDRDAMDTDLTMSMGALGIRGTLLQPSQPGGLELALRSDVLWMGMDSAAAHDLAATEAQASRLRLVLEGSRPVALAGGGSFTPSLEIGLRHDGGDAETGTGVEVGGSLRYDSASGLSIEASVRSLLSHEAQDYKEWGASGALRFDPGRRGRGFTASIVPTWGTAGSSAERLWDQSGTSRLPVPNALANAGTGRLDAELGYGLATMQGRGLLTPYARVALMEGAEQAWHIGTRLALAESLNFSLDASRRHREGDVAAHELALRANLGF